MRKDLLVFTYLIGVLFLVSCNKETTEITEALETPNHLVAPFTLETEEEWEAFAASLETTTATSRSRAIHLHANSHNQLQAIVDASRPYDHIIIDKGVHYEDQTVYVRHPLFIQGEEGATLYSSVKAIPSADAGLLQPAIHILNTRRVMIWNVDVKANTDAGGIGVLIEQSERCLVAKSSFHDFQSGIATQHGDYAFIWKNEVHSTTKGFTGEVADVYGIWLINGKKIRVIGNVVTNSIFGIWSCDLEGLAAHNECYNNFIGMILCNVPPVYQLPSGTIGSDNPGSNWLYRDNYSHDNVEVGFLVIDGAANNELIRNRGGNNGTYDIDASGPSLRFGTPAVPGSFNNHINSTDYPKNTIRDCGEGNVIVGGNWIRDAVCD